MVLAILRKQKVRALAPLLAAVMAAAAVMAVTPGTAHAATARPATAGQYCGTQDSGETGVINVALGYTWPKHSGCNDLNVVYTATAAPGHWDDYYGFLWTGSYWYECHESPQVLYNGTHDPITNPRAVLCTDILNGTIMTISASRGFDYVVIDD
jgi:hypothetical protein